MHCRLSNVHQLPVAEKRSGVAGEKLTSRAVVTCPFFAGVHGGRSALRWESLRRKCGLHRHYYVSFDGIMQRFVGALCLITVKLCEIAREQMT